jgi:hypothetical protein
VSGIGKGSSFDPPGQLDLSRLTGRWKDMEEDDPDWMLALENAEARDLNRKIFGWDI